MVESVIESTVPAWAPSSLKYLAVRSPCIPTIQRRTRMKISEDQDADAADEDQDEDQDDDDDDGSPHLIAV